MVVSACSGRVPITTASTHPDRGQIVISAVALHLVRVRVDRKHVVTPLAKAAVDDVAGVLLRMPGDAPVTPGACGSGICGCVFDGCHGILLGWRRDAASGTDILEQRNPRSLRKYRHRKT
jgi:hypothetical protein